LLRRQRAVSSRGEGPALEVDSPPVPNRTLSTFAACVLALLPGRALADGAFPDELQVFLPADQPSEIVLAANFGLLESTNNGQSWLYVCEAQAGATGNVSLYQMGPPAPTDALLGDAISGLYRSDSLGCAWSPAGGALAGKYVWDAAFDPNNPGAALAFSNPADAGPNSGLGASSSAIFPSTDDAVSFGPPVYVTPASLTGIEFSISSPGFVYVTGNEPGTDGGVTYFGSAFVMVGADGGASWGAPIDHPELNAELAGDAGADAGPPPPPIIHLAAVDPVDPLTVYVTLTLPNTNQYFLAVTHDGGKTLQILFQAPETITAFLRSSEGTLYVGTRDTVDAGGIFAAPLDGGAFQVVHQACPDGGVPSDGSCDVHVRCLGERAGLIYACGDNWENHMALGASSDGAVHFTSLLQFVNISGLGCASTPSVETTCGPTWNALEELFGIDAGVPPSDAGTTTTTTTPNSGCGCGSAGGGAALLVVLALYAARRKRAR
jgi:MYXO-CTERM domain-containing protein